MINIHTEEEAKGKRCPFPIKVTQSLECEGGGCMAWRYVETLNPKTLLHVQVAGYCGLGGKPE